MSGIVAGGTSANTNNRFNKAGAGTLAFTAENTYYGNTIVSGGTLMIGDGGTSGGVSMNSSEIILEAGTTPAVTRSDTVTQGSDSFKGPVTGDGSFAQVGPGSTVLMLANTYTGPTHIHSGILSLGRRTSCLTGPRSSSATPRSTPVPSQRTPVASTSKARRHFSLVRVPDSLLKTAVPSAGPVIRSASQAPSCPAYRSASVPIAAA